MRPQSQSTPWATLLFALLGLVWCGYVAFPTANPAPCVTSGCALFRDSKFAGISLWWVGGAYFFLLTVLCLKGSRSVARILAMLALFADAILLVIMLLTAPCFECLVVAAIMALCYYSLKPTQDGWFAGVEVSPSLLLPVWFGLFLGNSVLAVNEQFPLQPIGNVRNAEVRIYFAPSCRACREAVSSPLGATMELYPVLEREEDFDSFLRLIAMLKDNVPLNEAIMRSINEAEPVPSVSLYERMVLTVQLLRNKAALLRQGIHGLPLIQANGWKVEKPSASGGQAGSSGRSRANAATPPPQPRNPEVPQVPPLSETPPEGSAAGFTAPDHLQPGNGTALPDFLADPDALEQCGDSRPCD